MNVSWNAITLVTVGTVVLALLAFVACGALVVHHAISDALHRRHERRTQQVLLLLAPHIVGGDELPEQATAAVRRFGHAPVAEILRRARNDLAGGPAVALAAALESIGEVRRLSRRARSASASRRRTAVRHLGECGGDAARDALAKALDDREWEVRRAARDGLLADGRDESIRLAVESYLGESVRSLGWRRSFYARFSLVAPEQLCALLREGTLVPDEEKLAIDALGHARARDAVAEVRLRLDSSDPELRASAARFAGKLDDADACDQLVQLLHDPEWFVRAAAARGLEALPKPLDALHALGTRLEDRTWWVRSNAARTLARAGQSGRRILLRAISRNDAYARDAAVAALATERMAGSRSGTPRFEAHPC